MGWCRRHRLTVRRTHQVGGSNSDGVNIAVKVAVRIAVKFECCDAGMNKPSRLKPRHLIPVALVGLVAACVLVVSRRDSPEEIAAATAAAVAEIGPPPGEVLLSRRSDGDVAERFWEFETTAGELTAWADALPIRLGCTDVRWSVRKEARGEIAGLFKVSCMVERDGQSLRVGASAFTYPDGIGWTTTWARRLDD
jgi:hypothetical protein